MTEKNLSISIFTEKMSNLTYIPSSNNQQTGAQSSLSQ